MSDETRGLCLGLLGVSLFAMTAPMTRLAVGPADAPQLSPFFVVAGRAALAALLSAAYLWFTRARGERLHPATLLFSLAVVATVFLGKTMPIPSPQRKSR